MEVISDPWFSVFMLYVIFGSFVLPKLISRNKLLLVSFCSVIVYITQVFVLLPKQSISHALLFSAFLLGVNLTAGLYLSRSKYNA